MEMAFDYYTLLDRITLLSDGQKHRITPPYVRRLNTRASEWTNFGTICNELKRDQLHVMTFVLSELGATGSLRPSKENGSERLIMSSKFSQTQIETILLKYIQTYVQCHACKSLDTLYERNQIQRVFMITCSVCKSTRFLRS